MALESDGGKIIHGYVDGGKDYSEEMSAVIDREVKKIMTDSLELARKTIGENKKVLDAIAKKLLEVETLEQDEYNKLIMTFGIKPKKREEGKEAIDIVG